MTQIQLPEKVNYIISQLEQAGFEAYAVGGCVRAVSYTHLTLPTNSKV